MAVVRLQMGVLANLGRYRKWLGGAFAGCLYGFLFTSAAAETWLDLRFPNWSECPKWSGQLIAPLLIPSASDRERFRLQLERQVAERKPDSNPRPETAEERELRERIGQSMKQQAPLIVSKLIKDCPEIAVEMLFSPTRRRRLEIESLQRYVEILELRDRLSAARSTDSRLLELQRQLEEANRRLRDIEFQQHLGR